MNKELEQTQQSLNDYKNLLSEKLSGTTVALQESLDLIQKETSRLGSREIEHAQRISDCETGLRSVIEQTRILYAE